MSRYTVDTGIDIGWDAPFGEFFAQVFDSEDELVDEWTSAHLAPVLKWVGDQGALVSRETIKSLVIDSEEPWKPGPLQKQLGFEARS